MNLNKLRTVRIIISNIILFLTTLLFVELSGNYTVSFSDYVLFPQFIPSLLSFLHNPAFIASGFIIILVLTVLFGRIYCSFVCPLGIMMDLILFVRKKYYKFSTRKKFRFTFIKSYNLIRYSILSATFLLLFTGVSTLIVLLDPYSVFGRLITNFIRPVFIGINNLLVAFLEMLGSYSVSPHILYLPDFWVLSIPFVFLIIILFFTLKNGRLYCNTICPVGALLGLISNFQIFKISIDDINCAACGVCETQCKAGCIDSGNKSIDLTRCVACYDCLDSCPTEAISINTKQPVKVLKSNLKTKVKGRRSFLISAGLLTGTAIKTIYGQGDTIKVYKDSTIPEKRTSPISPPGSISIEHFISNCTACTLCVSVCPTGVLQPSFIEYGIEGLLMPHMSNKIGFCNFECTICGDVCPNDAILPLKNENKKITQIGKVKFIKENCVVYTQKTDCGACAEHCPTKAVKMELDAELNLRVPIITEELCVGCGACEHACPTKPFKSIYVDGNPVHQIAEKPKDEKLEIIEEEDFPF
ncbi:MAG: 4Fe-4S ferredoxin [Ignavibacteriae bacterium HGW-Ignavibacteriae-2]|jgi:ferredoxin-type protein NapF|nr:MAG: 4Fe-4S ferredoxin [Ignavibacteriae bacterium HGW-Ignavibacteriae-2]